MYASALKSSLPPFRKAKEGLRPEAEHWNSKPMPTFAAVLKSDMLSHLSITLDVLNLNPI